VLWTRLIMIARSRILLSVDWVHVTLDLRLCLSGVGTTIPEKSEGTWEPRSHTLNLHFWYWSHFLKNAPNSVSNLSFGARLPATSSNFIRYEHNIVMVKKSHFSLNQAYQLTLIQISLFYLIKRGFLTLYSNWTFCR